MPNANPPNGGVFVVTEEIYRDRKVYAVSMSLNGAKLACLAAMGLTRKAINRVNWVDPELERPGYRFQMDQGYLEMFSEGTPLPFRIEWKSVLP